MDMSKVFKAAHRLAKRTVKTGDNYQVTFGLCLKFIINAQKAKLVRIEPIVIKLDDRKTFEQFIMANGSIIQVSHDKRTKTYFVNTYGKTDKTISNIRRSQAEYIVNTLMNK